MANSELVTIYLSTESKQALKITKKMQNTEFIIQRNKMDRNQRYGKWKPDGKYRRGRKSGVGGEGLNAESFLGINQYCSPNLLRI